MHWTTSSLTGAPAAWREREGGEGGGGGGGGGEGGGGEREEGRGSEGERGGGEGERVRGGGEERGTVHNIFQAPPPLISDLSSCLCDEPLAPPLSQRPRPHFPRLRPFSD